MIIRCFHLSIYRNHIALSLLNLSSSYCPLVNLSSSYWFSLVSLCSSYFAITCQSIVIILCFLWSIYRVHIASLLVNLSSSYCDITCQSIFIILRFHLWIFRHHIAFSLLILSSLFCAFTLSIYYHHFTLFVFN